MLREGGQMSFDKEESLHSLSQISINYIFFGFYFIFIALIHLYHVFLIEPQVTFSRYFFFLYAFMQCAIETLLLVLFANAIKIFFRDKAMALYSIVVFFLMLTHVIDFPLVRFMDMSFWYGLNFISAESPKNFLELLYASNVSLFIWILGGILGFAILFSAIFLYRLTARWSHKRPLIIRYPLLAAVLCTLCLFLMSWDYSTHKWVCNPYFSQYQKTLPWKSTFFVERQEYFPLAHCLKKPVSKENMLNCVQQAPFTCQSKPDIFLFVIESLREDYINSVQAPHFSEFRNDHIAFDLALSNANATQISWFSLFYSQYPFYFGMDQLKQWDKGSLPLLLLKKMGYEIYCYSSARLGYYQMDKVIFGENLLLADELITFDNHNAQVPCERDKKAMQTLIEKMQEKPSGGRLFIVFLDATHHDYSWPKEEYCIFKPYEEKINFLKAALCNSGLELIKNRYRNALFFVDSLFGKFMQALNAHPSRDEAVVIVTGDHGEEFYESGHLFHASNLSQAQMHVPLYFKFGKNSKQAIDEHQKRLCCHMDIFPSLFHYLTGQDCMREILQGESIFRKERWPYLVCGRFNASRSPCEFCIHNGKNKLIATFSDERDIFNSKGLRIVSTKNMQDEIIPHDIHFIKEQFSDALDHLFAP